MSGWCKNKISILSMARIKMNIYIIFSNNYLFLFFNHTAISLLLARLETNCPACKVEMLLENLLEKS